MANVEAMAVGETGDHLTEYAYSFRFWKTAIFGYVVKQLAAFDELQDKVTLDLWSVIPSKSRYDHRKLTVHPCSPRHRRG